MAICTRLILGFAWLGMVFAWAAVAVYVGGSLVAYLKFSYDEFWEGWREGLEERNERNS